MSTTLGLIYFLRAVGGEGRVKIGFSTDLPRRLRAIQASSPVELECVAYFSGKAQDEATLHALFREQRAHGEWFEPVAELLAIVDQHRSALEGDVHTSEPGQVDEVAQSRLAQHYFDQQLRRRDALPAHRRTPQPERQRPFRKVA